MASDTVGASPELAPSRAWWLRVPAVLLSPRSVFFALREEDEDDVAARSEPLLLVIWLAGMASVLATPTAADILDDPEYDTVLLVVWTFIAGGLYGVVGYFVLGLAIASACDSSEASATSDARDRRSGSRSCHSRCRCSSCCPCGSRSTAGTRFGAEARTKGRVRRVLLVVQLVFVAWSLALLVDRCARHARLELAAGGSRRWRGPSRS